MTTSRKLSEVFGVSRGIPLTYVTRKYVDDRFVSSLTREKHIVVFGGSKQGKTSLRKHCLLPVDSVVIQCSGTSSRGQIYEMLLKEAGASVSATETKTSAGQTKVQVSFNASGGIPGLFDAGGEGGGELTRDRATAVTRNEFEIDPSDTNDVIRVLTTQGFDRYIVLEDFHYLPEEVQKEIAIDLKAFHEKSSLVFIVVGVWLESNRLVLYNGDLAGRLVPIDADRWEPRDLRAVIDAGEALLNISFPEDVKDLVLERCQDNVGLLQEVCYLLCQTAGVMQTCAVLRAVGTVDEVELAVAEIASEHASRYQGFLQQFVEGFQRTELEMYRWIAYVLISSPPGLLKRGLNCKEVFRHLNEVHPSHKGKLLWNNVVQALRNVGKLQHKNRIQPVILDYVDSDNLLKVVDSGFILFCTSQPRERLLEYISVEETGGYDWIMDLFDFPQPSVKRNGLFDL